MLACYGIEISPRGGLCELSGWTGRRSFVNRGLSAFANKNAARPCEMSNAKVGGGTRWPRYCGAGILGWNLWVGVGHPGAMDSLYWRACGYGLCGAALGWTSEIAVFLEVPAGNVMFIAGVVLGWAGFRRPGDVGPSRARRLSRYSQEQLGIDAKGPTRWG